MTYRFVLFLTLLGIFFSPHLSYAGEENPLRGTQFISLVKGKTLSGKNLSGSRYNSFFLQGGLITYEDEDGRKDSGRWRVKDGKNICVKWKKRFDNQERCSSATYKDHKIYFRSSLGNRTVNLRPYIARDFK